jgi:hypothetical protein
MAQTQQASRSAIPWNHVAGAQWFLSPNWSVIGDFYGNFASGYQA